MSKRIVYQQVGTLGDVVGWRRRFSVVVGPAYHEMLRRRIRRARQEEGFRDFWPHRGKCPRHKIKLQPLKRHVFGKVLEWGCDKCFEELVALQWEWRCRWIEAGKGIVLDA